MQRHRQEEMSARKKILDRKLARKALGHGEATPVLERLHQLVARELVAPKGGRGIEMRGMCEAVSANRRARAWQSALRATLRQRRQRSRAADAKEFPPGVRAAEQTILAYPGL